ncbi:malonyl-ACP O-methyltransferase BioC [Acinetobacter boissieri]|uniref:Malonyl-[acyl-carrier protein] O-methyltransferase n=1 Tax=Acinetobacter boissieri TaxID=1219383 RepID=A0A1G6HC89_9GAMM|nr:malonyl-ACP O-methyltransferase BioC [Acinetobacter boissieri]SDB91056.1 malonyl-CoA O-methyltransferase [Acinetobacter boissieri]
MQIDKNKVKQRFARAKESYSEQAIAQQKICLYLSRLMAKYVSAPIDNMLEVGCGSGNLTRQMLLQYRPKHYFANDIYAEVEQFFQPTDPIEFCIGDIEQMPLPSHLTAVVSSSALQWVQDLEPLFARIQQALEPRGWLVFSSFAEQNLQEIKALTGHGLDYVSMASIKSRLDRQGFDVIHIEQKNMTLWFSHPLRVLKHLKATGVTASQGDFVWNKQKLQQFYDDYAEFSELDAEGNSQYALTYQPLYVIARKK